jgi:two-component system chemotaxis response regulator CheY
MLSILVVDDDTDFRDLLTKYLTDNTENEVLCAGNGTEALAILTHRLHNNRPINFIIADVYMPGMDGRKYYEAVRALDAYRHVPFLFVSAYDDEYARDSVFEPYIEGFMKKSETASKLLNWIEYLATPLSKRTRVVRPAE